MAIPIAVVPRKAAEDLMTTFPKTDAIRYRRGELIYDARQSPDYFYLVIEGAVMISRTANKNREVVVDICPPQKIFGESSLISRFHVGEQALALEDSNIMRWSVSQIVDSVRHQSRLGMTLLQRLAEREAELTWRMQSLALDSIHLRMAQCLIRLSVRLGVRQRDGSSRLPALTHKMLSQYIGSTREIVTHHLVEFRKLGLVSYSRSGIIIYQDVFMEWLKRNLQHSFGPLD